MDRPSDPRDTIKNQEKTITSLRGDLASRGQVIDKLTAKTKELTERLADLQVLLEHEQNERAVAVANLEELKAIHAASLEERDRAHAEESAFLERAQQDASEAANRRLRDSERMLAAERATFVESSEAHGLEIAELRQELAMVVRDRDAAIRALDEARLAAETSAMDVARVQMDAQSQQQRMAEMEVALATRTDKQASFENVEAELEAARAKIASLTQALEAMERDTVQQQLARDAAFHEMSVRAAEELAREVEIVKAQAAAEREELVRTHEHALKVARDKAIAQTLAVARERKKQTE